MNEPDRSQTPTATPDDAPVSNHTTERPLLQDTLPANLADDLYVQYLARVADEGRRRLTEERDDHRETRLLVLASEKRHADTLVRLSDVQGEAADLRAKLAGSSRWAPIVLLIVFMLASVALVVVPAVTA